MIRKTTGENIDICGERIRFSIVHNNNNHEDGF